MINDNNLSRAWSRLLLGILDGAGTEVSPLVLSVTGFDDKGVTPEDPAVRQALDQLLKRKGRLKVEDVAFTIFPQRLWEMSRGDRTRLFTLYRATFPRWQAMNKKANGRGLYFERMVMYGRGPCDGNQLEWILSQYGSRASGRASLDAAGDDVRPGPRSCRERAARLSLPTTGQLRADRRRPGRECLLCNPTNLRQSLW